MPTPVLMDIHLGGIDGYETTRRIKAAAPTVCVLLVSTHRDLPADALDCGAVGYVNKEDFGPTVLRWAVDGGASGS